MEQVTRAVLVTILLLVVSPVRSVARAAETDGWVATVTTLAVAPRPYAPLWVEVGITAPVSRVLEGRLEFVLGDGVSQTEFVFRTEPIAVASNEQRYQFLLPTTTSFSPSDVELNFDTGDERIDLGQHFLFVNPSSARAFHIGPLRPESPTPTPYNLLNNVRMDRWFEVFTGEPSRRVLLTSVTRFSAADASIRALDYCALDLVVIDRPAFPLVRETTWKALVTWVRGGGSLCLVVPETLTEIQATSSLGPGVP